jgi:serine/threonine protein kinase
VVAIEATPTLAERLAAGPLPPERAAALALGLLRAVRRAHRIGLVHGALAPSQIWTRDDGSIVLDLTGVATAPVPDQPHPAQDSGFEADVAATAALVDMLLAGQAQAVGTRAMLTAMRHPDLEQRPTIGEGLRALAPMPWCTPPPAPAASARAWCPSPAPCSAATA